MHIWHILPHAFTLLYTHHPAFDTKPQTYIPRVTVKLHIAEFPAASVAAHSTVVTPNGNIDPDSILHKISGDISTLSVAVGLGQDAWEDVVTISLGQVIVGGTWSTTGSRTKQIIRNK